MLLEGMAAERCDGVKSSQDNGTINQIRTSCRSFVLLGAVERRGAPGFGRRDDISNDYGCVKY